MNYIIRSQTEVDENQCPLFWSNTDGWVSVGSELAVYDQSELNKFSLPLGGEWVAVNVLGQALELFAALALILENWDRGDLAYAVRAGAAVIEDIKNGSGL